MSNEKKAAGEEIYAQPLLTKHDALHALTGASGVKTRDEKITDKTVGEQ